MFKVGDIVEAMDYGIVRIVGETDNGYMIEACGFRYEVPVEDVHVLKGRYDEMSIHAYVNAFVENILRETNMFNRCEVMNIAFETLHELI